MLLELVPISLPAQDQVSGERYRTVGPLVYLWQLLSLQNYMTSLADFSSPGFVN